MSLSIPSKSFNISLLYDPLLIEGDTISTEILRELPGFKGVFIVKMFAMAHSYFMVSL